MLTPSKLTPSKPTAPDGVSTAASGFLSVPVVPVQPEQLTYSTADLELFSYPNPANPNSSVLTRALYLSLNGVQAPPYDPTNPTRNWYDQSPAPGYPAAGSYLVVEVKGTSASIASIAVPANVAVPNLSGPYQYPAWVNSPTTVALLSLPDEPGGPTPLNPDLLISLADAEAVLAALPAGSTISEYAEDEQVIWGTETRRQYTVSVPNGPQNQACQPLRQVMTAVRTDPDGNYVSGGVGSPGAFEVTAATIMWTPLQDPGLSAGAPTPVPCRALIADGTDQEVLVPGPLSMGVQVLRLDFLAGSSTGSAAGGLSEDQGAWVLQALQAIGEYLKLGLPAPPAA